MCGAAKCERTWWVACWHFLMSKRQAALTYFGFGGPDSTEPC